MKIINIILIIFICFTQNNNIKEKNNNCSEPIKYVNRNQIDPPALKINKIEGKVLSDIYPVPEACIGLFTDNEKDPKLILTTVTNKNGFFKIRNVKPNQYRLIVKYDSLCTANIQIELLPSSNKNSVVVHMLNYGGYGMEGCSYADYK